MKYNLFEPEETVGFIWHNLVGRHPGPPTFPSAGISFENVGRKIGVFYRALGGDSGVDIKASSPEATSFRMKFRERLGNDTGYIAQARFDGDTLFLPEKLDALPDADLNQELYFWLSAWAATAGERLPEYTGDDPLQRDIAYLRHVNAITQETLTHFSGLEERYHDLRQAFLETRPRRKLPPQEEAVEAALIHLLGGPETESVDLLDPVLPLKNWTADKNYKPHMPVSLWGVTLPQPERQAIRREEEDETEGATPQDEIRLNKTVKARRRDSDQIERKDSILLYPFSALMSFADMLNINRKVEDDDPDQAQKALEDQDEIALSDISKVPSTRLSFDLNMAPEDIDTERLSGEHLYPEWDYRKKDHYKDYCRVLAHTAPEGEEGWKPDAASQKRIRAVQRQFEALRPRREILRGQLDGTEFDMDALIRARCDLQAKGEGSDRIYLRPQNQTRDLAVSVLIDVSRSTESWIEGRQVIDIEREALVALTQGLAACGDEHAIYSFSSLKRERVFVSTIKGFDEPSGPRILSRIGAIKPSFYTRLGGAIRHVASELETRPNAYRLLLVITDGKPNDLDHYEGRYGIEDTTEAIREVRRKGLSVFGITIDAKAQNYFPHIFGTGAYAIISHPDKLTQNLPQLYRHLVA
ncbi:MAG: VWA domain-containing protein [Rhodospirillales bacterium]|nr:VWA domain-containing protein [Rhodospirillales bacterium]